MGPHIFPKWVPYGSKIAPQRSRGDLWCPWGAQGGPRQIFKRLWGPFRVRFWIPQLFQMRQNSNLNHGSLLMLIFVALEVSWVAFGNHFGIILGYFWGPNAGSRMSEKPLNTVEKHCFWGSRGSKIDQKSIKNRCKKYLKMRPRFKTDKTFILSSFWLRFGVQERPEIDHTSMQKMPQDKTSSWQPTSLPTDGQLGPT